MWTRPRFVEKSSSMYIHPRICCCMGSCAVDLLMPQCIHGSCLERTCGVLSEPHVVLASVTVSQVKVSVRCATVQWFHGKGNALEVVLDCSYPCGNSTWRTDTHVWRLVRSLPAALLRVMHVTILLHKTLRKCKAALLVACARLSLLVRACVCVFIEPKQAPKFQTHMHTNDGPTNFKAECRIEITHILIYCLVLNSTLQKVWGQIEFVKMPRAHNIP